MKITGEDIFPAVIFGIVAAIMLSIGQVLLGYPLEGGRGLLSFLEYFFGGMIGSLAFAVSARR